MFFSWLNHVKWLKEAVEKHSSKLETVRRVVVVVQTKMFKEIVALIVFSKNA